MASAPPNCTTVHRIWSDGSGELLAIFQYESDAKAFTKTYEGVRETPYSLIIFNTCTLSITIVKKNEPVI